MSEQSQERMELYLVLKSFYVEEKEKENELYQRLCNLDDRKYELQNLLQAKSSVDTQDSVFSTHSSSTVNKQVFDKQRLELEQVNAEICEVQAEHHKVKCHVNEIDDIINMWCEMTKKADNENNDVVVMKEHWKEMMQTMIKKLSFMSQIVYQDPMRVQLELQDICRSLNNSINEMKLEDFE